MPMLLQWKREYMVPTHFLFVVYTYGTADMLFPLNKLQNTPLSFILNDMVSKATSFKEEEGGK